MQREHLIKASGAAAASAGAVPSQPGWAVSRASHKARRGCVWANIALPWLCPPPAPWVWWDERVHPPTVSAAGAVGGGRTPQQLRDGQVPLELATGNVEFRILHNFEVAAI